ncbi:Tim44 domain-containing protein [Pollutimonas bauzanensis]|uniref:Predicted lipid-binding transport protein, Tim44 family n=1 Tax=Pollutimonas bauzanensis TaxID=658167 RepID=A0A1M5R9K7_9BURK|nr:TIM44-like domain-containing protein [Pollutimonas bauzanensis]SHH23034.1 Predicted lipid-binding transport protein, Tim44 family [Pollutimonas bauzanensis]
MSHRFSRLIAIAMLVVSAGAMLSVSFDAEARRFGGGKSLGRQSSNVTQQRQAVTPPAASNNMSRAAAPAAGAAAAGTAAKSGMSRFLGPIAGIAAGLGIAALLSSMGLSGAFLEAMSSMLLIGLLIFGVMFIVRRLRAGAARPAMQQAGASHGPLHRQNAQSQGAQSQNTWREAGQPVAASSAANAAAIAAVPAAPLNDKWFIPGDFDSSAFLANAKSQFIEIQAVWDSGDLEKLRDYMTDDLIAEVKPEILARSEGTQTQVVLLNAELLGIEAVSGGHLASVRYSGMLREAREAEAFRFEEVWNLYKADGAGWLLAGIQQIPVEYAS